MLYLLRCVPALSAHRTCYLWFFRPTRMALDRFRLRSRSSQPQSRPSYPAESGLLAVDVYRVNCEDMHCRVSLLLGADAFLERKKMFRVNEHNLSSSLVLLLSSLSQEMSSPRSSASKPFSPLPSRLAPANGSRTTDARMVIAASPQAHRDDIAEILHLFIWGSFTTCMGPSV